MPEILLLMFSSRICMVLWLTFKSFIYFEFLLMYGVTWWSSLIFFACTCPVFPTPFIKETVFSPLYGVYQIWIDHKGVGLFLGSLFCCIDLCVCSYASTRMLCLQRPCTIVWYQVLWSLQFCSSSSKLLKLFRVLCGSIYIFGLFVLYLWNILLVF